MEEIEIKRRIKSGCELLEERAYNREDFEAHMYSIIKDHFSSQPDHKRHLESMIYAVSLLLGDTRAHLGGRKSKSVAVKDKCDILEKNIKWLLTNGYSVERFQKQKEEELF